MSNHHTSSERSRDVLVYDTSKLETAPSREDHEWDTERRLKRKMDLRIIPSACIIYLLCFLDRSNIGNAKLLNHDTHNALTDSLHLVGQQYLISLMIFLIAYTTFEIPSNIMLKKFKPSRWIAFLMFIWGTLTMALGGVNNYTQIAIVRFLLGAAEAGLFPGLVYFLTFWYKPEERSLRVALILASSTLAGAFGGAIAYGVGQMNGFHGVEGWRWLFILEGLPSCVSALFVLFLFPDWPETATWLTESDKALATSRLQGVASKANSEITRRELKDTLLDWRLYGHYMVYLCISVPFSSISLFAPTIVSGLGYEGLRAQLFTVPPYACAYAVTLLVSFSSDHFNARSLYAMTGMLIGAIAFITQALLSDQDFAARYALLCIATSSSFSAIPPLLGWLSSNLHSTGAASLAIAMSVSFGGPGQIIGVWIYKANESPGYVTGHLVNFAVLLWGAIVVLILRIFYVRKNASLPTEARKWVL